MTIQSGCTNYNSVNVTVPSNGTIVVRANLFVSLNHASGTRDYATFHIGLTSTQCSSADNHQRAAMVPTLGPTDTYDSQVGVEQAYSVSAGTYSYYANAKATSGQDGNDRIQEGILTADFFPS